MANIIWIDSVEDERVDLYVRLTEPQLRNRLEPKKGIFIAESPKVIMRALDAGYRPISFLMEDKHAQGDAAPILQRCPDVPCYVGPRGILTDLIGYKLTRGVLCAMHRPSLPSPEEVVEGATRIAVLENINNHTNIGSIFRSAAALGIDAVLLSPTCCDPLYRRSARVSMGAVFQVPWTYMGAKTSEWPHMFFELMNKKGFKTAAFALNEHALPLDDARLKDAKKLALIFGAEGPGLDKHTIQNCDYVVKIPMHHGVDSLNVATSSAIAFWELRN